VNLLFGWNNLRTTNKLYKIKKGWNHFSDSAFINLFYKFYSTTNWANRYFFPICV
jgi:hypothetical protein